MDTIDKTLDKLFDDLKEFYKHRRSAKYLRDELKPIDLPMLLAELKAAVAQITIEPAKPATVESEDELDGEVADVVNQTLSNLFEDLPKDSVFDTESPTPPPPPLQQSKAFTEPPPIEYPPISEAPRSFWYGEQQISQEPRRVFRTIHFCADAIWCQEYIGAPPRLNVAALKDIVATCDSQMASGIPWDQLSERYRSVIVTACSAHAKWYHATHNQ